MRMCTFLKLKLVVIDYKMFVYVDKEKSHKSFVMIVVIASLVAASACLFFSWWICKRKGKILSC